ncbi:MAG: D-alanine--D-alanine ligase [Candidatus Cloacimonetes bacterium]|nr:D-alanine--D-alanine ligase [Candidatus Cloacimonadota bacterium]
MQKIIILGGGDSTEREISLITSRTIQKALATRNIAAEIIDPAEFSSWLTLLSSLEKLEPEMIFLGLHGAAGEDGRLQGMLELCNLPFTGSGSRASALAMDKNAALCLVSNLQIPVAKRLLLHKKDQIEIQEISNYIGLPLVVKPNSFGSSVGISIVQESDQLQLALLNAWKYEDWILCEKFIAGRELTVTILDGRALPVVEISPRKGWYDYTNKYTHGNTEYLCPAVLTAEETALLQEYAEQIFHRLDCRVYGRIDFRYDGNKFYFLEVNTLPGMTSLSLTPMAAKTAGLELPDLLLKIIELSQNR